MSRIVFQLHSSIKKRLLEDKKTINKLKINLPMVKLCDPYRIQTCNLLIRSQMLYSVELRGRIEAHGFIFLLPIREGLHLIIYKRTTLLQMRLLPSGLQVSFP